MHFDTAAFYRFTESYPANSYEAREPTHWLHTQKVRFGLTLQAYLRHRPAETAPAILDIGGYPGSLVKTLRLYLRESGTIDAAGLAGPDDFMQELAGYQVGFYPCNLDPLIGSYASPKELPVRIQREDASYEVIFATEIIEHTLDPLYLLKESFRLLRPGGVLMLTTPNQATLSNRLRALSGRSMYFPLKRSIMYDRSDWRPHIREYTMWEMATLLQDSGFEVVEKQFMDISQDDPRFWGWSHPLLRLARTALSPLMLIPSMRQGLLLVARRPN
ncbi:MAG: methyltransferase domain-containing protein [Candidatus Eremiobacteraeota bacterium]|nr:methyltransferase domain-containing protein [Candidatus Eremiobacteraeota bacterium]MCW5868387.1 methyltransferase domain-containing protein [Candidatus Eremiobacteraeota bacterium]